MDHRERTWRRAKSLVDKPNPTAEELREADELLADLDRMDSGANRAVNRSFAPAFGTSGRGANSMDDDELDPQALAAVRGRVPNYRTAYQRSGNPLLQSLADDSYAQAFRSYVRGEPFESRDLGVGTGASGGYMVPPQFLQQLIEAQLAYGGLRVVATILNTSDMGGADLPVPTDSDTAQAGAILAEAGALPTQDIGAFGQTVLHSYMYTSKMIKVSMQLMQDAFFPIEIYLARKLGIRLARIQNTHFTNGTGTGQPNGVVTAATLGKTGLVGQTLSVIYDDLVDLVHSVDPAYRGQTPGLPVQLNTGSGVPTPRPCFMFHDSTLKVIRKLKDSQGHPLWAPPGLYYPGFAGPAPETILGFPYIINNDVPVMAANAKSILFGDFSNYFIRDALDVQVVRLDERFMDNLQKAFIAFQRTDGNLINAGTAPVKYYANSAT
jgi:HK97 family phage major capsid protein